MPVRRSREAPRPWSAARRRPGGFVLTTTFPTAKATEERRNEA
ncbi:hypothetical protein [Streptomyces sp. NPDC060002]